MTTVLSTHGHAMLNAPGLGESQQSLLSRLKERGLATIPELAQDIGLNIETVRGHLRSLEAAGLARRGGSRSMGPGRPEVVYAVTEAAEAFFPRREAETLRELTAHLVNHGQGHLLKEFFEGQIAGRRAEALERVRHLEGRARVEEVGRIFTELGFMAVVEGSDAAPQLRLCHCPIRSIISETSLPCMAEIGLMRELLGEDLMRESYIPAGDASCSYRVAS